MNRLKMRLLQTRQSWWRGKARYRERQVKRHQARKDQPGVEKWSKLLAEARKEVSRYDVAIHALLPHPTSVQKKEAELAHEHPEIHRAIRSLTAEVMVNNPQMYVTATTGGHHAANSYHYLGRAVDLGANSQGPKDRCGQWCNEHVVRRCVEGIHNPNFSVDQYHHVDASFWGDETWAMHVNHVHIAA